MRGAGGLDGHRHEGRLFFPCLRGTDQRAADLLHENQFPPPHDVIEVHRDDITLCREVREFAMGLCAPDPATLNIINSLHVVFALQDHKVQLQDYEIRK